MSARRLTFVVAVVAALAPAAARADGESPPEEPTPPVAAPAPAPPAPASPSAPPVSDVATAAAAVPAADRALQRNFAGSIQFDYLAVPQERVARSDALDAGTVEVSLKLAVDLTDHVSANVKLCYACHGPEVGMAYFDLRAVDQLNVRVGRFTPAFGSFPLRHDPANHRTSDKPLPYDMGRMLHHSDWNEGILPAPWVDNGIEVDGSMFFVKSQLDYAVYAIGGPKGAGNGNDFDYTQSRSGALYYVDNNSQPTVGGRLALTLRMTDAATLALGTSVMAGRYDPQAKLNFWIVGADAVLQISRVFLRAEYLVRRTQIALGESPAMLFKYGPGGDGRWDDHVLKDGFYAETEVPIGRVDLIARWDGLRRWGNVLATSALRSRSEMLRYTLGTAIRVAGSVRIKLSVEEYDFSDFQDELALHAGVAGSF